MKTYQFIIYPIDTSMPQNCIVHVEGETYFVHIEGNFIGSMVKDSDSDFGFATDNKELKPLIESLAGHIQEKSLREEFPEVLKAVWGENIVSTEFVNEETLMVVCHQDTDLDEFGNVVLDIITDYVEFDEYLELILTKTDSEEIFEVGIN